MDISCMDKSHAVRRFQQKTPFVVKPSGNAFRRPAVLQDGNITPSQQVMAVPIIHEWTQIGGILPFVKNNFKTIEKRRQYLFAVP